MILCLNKGTDHGGLYEPALAMTLVWKYVKWMVCFSPSIRNKDEVKPKKKQDKTEEPSLL